MSSSQPTRSSRRLVGISTKMYFTYAQTLSYATSLLQHVSTISSPALANTDIFLLPDHLSLAAVAGLLNPSNSTTTITHPQSVTPTATSPLTSSKPTASHPTILYGAQNSSSHAHGPYTGEISPRVLGELGCTFVELGHAERRRLFHEDDSTTAAKSATVASEGMTPLVCIGEVERGSGSLGESVGVAIEAVRVQVESVLDAVDAVDAVEGGQGKGQAKDVVFAYEPVWAIGAAEPADAEYVVGVVEGIRRVIGERGRRGEVRVLYGGSAKLGLMGKIGGAVDGLFLGRFAHDAEMAARIILEVAEA